MNTKNLNDSLTLLKKDSSQPQQPVVPVKKYNKKHKRTKDKTLIQAAASAAAPTNYASNNASSHHHHHHHHHHHNSHKTEAPQASHAAADGEPQKVPDFQSKVETAILNSNEPIEINESAEVSANGFKGIWANKTEIANWVGPVPLSEYPLNQDHNPILIKKKSNKKLEYEKKVFVKYLEPPAIPPPGEIIVNQEANKLAPEAPPIVIRQRPNRKRTPEPIIIREAPPPPPPVVPPKIITIPGKTIRRPREIIFEYDCQPCQQCKPPKLCQDANCFPKCYKGPANFYPAPYPLQFSPSSSNLPFFPNGAYPSLGFPTIFI